MIKWEVKTKICGRDSNNKSEVNIALWKMGDPWKCTQALSKKGFFIWCLQGFELCIEQQIGIPVQ